MTTIRLFISSVQKELASERAVLRDWLRSDALMRRSFVNTLRRIPERATEIVGGQVTPPVASSTPLAVTELVRLLAQAGALGNAEIRRHLGLKDRTHLRERCLDPVLADGLIEPTIPDKPDSRLQQYRLTEKGVELLDRLNREARPS
jgi:hypothetical protein